MFLFTLLPILMILLYAYLGHRDGLLGAGINLVYALLSYLFTMTYVDDLAELMVGDPSQPSFDPSFATIISFLVLFGVSFGILRAVLAKAAPLERVQFEPHINLVGGLALGALAGLLVSYVIASFFLLIPFFHTMSNIENTPVYKLARSGVAVYRLVSLLPGVSANRTLDPDLYYRDKAIKTDWDETKARLAEGEKKDDYNGQLSNIDSFLKRHPRREGQPTSTFVAEAERKRADVVKRVAALYLTAFTSAKKIVEPEIVKMRDAQWEYLMPEKFGEAEGRFGNITSDLRNASLVELWKEWGAEIDRARTFCQRLRVVAENLKRGAFDFSANEVARLLRECPDCIYAAELAEIEAKVRRASADELSELRKAAENLEAEAKQADPAKAADLTKQALQLWETFAAKTANPAHRDVARREVARLKELVDKKVREEKEFAEVSKQLEGWIARVSDDLGRALDEAKALRARKALAIIEKLQQELAPAMDKIRKTAHSIPDDRNPESLLKKQQPLIKNVCELHLALIEAINTHKGDPKPLPVKTGYTEPQIKSADDRQLFFTRTRLSVTGPKRDPNLLPLPWEKISSADMLKLYQLYIPADPRIEDFKRLHGIK